MKRYLYLFLIAFVGMVLVMCDSPYKHSDFVDKRVYYITVETDNSVMGSVTGSGEYKSGQQIAIQALPNEHYEFKYWNDNSESNPRNLIVSSDSTFVAYFDLTNYNVSVSSNDENLGTVSGGGVYRAFETATIVATPTLGNRFMYWSDGVTDSLRNIYVDHHVNLFAYFDNAQYTVVLNSNDPTMGTVRSEESAENKNILLIEALPNKGYEFVDWSDGSVENPRYITLTRDTVLTANFRGQTHSVVVSVNNRQMGSVTGGGSYTTPEVAQLVATPYSGYRFIRWSDGNTDNPREFVVTESLVLTAYFDYFKYNILAEASDPTMGTVTGTGSYAPNAEVTLTAVPNVGYVFVNWSDGSTENPRTIIATADATYTANFEAISYTISVSVNDANMGSASGSGVYKMGSTVTLQASPNFGYAFVQWNDGNTDNPRNILVTTDAAYVAEFKETGATSGTHETHGYVDLGLPSGLLWATYNIGATRAEEVGSYYAWGEVASKSDYSWTTYLHATGNYQSLNKYNINSTYGVVDNKTTLELSDDAAYHTWGGNWRMPTKDEMSELVNNCTSYWATHNGVSGKVFVGPNGNSIFFPTSGYYNGNSLLSTRYGYYWTSTISNDYPNEGCELQISSSSTSVTNSYRTRGKTIRAVVSNLSSVAKYRLWGEANSSSMGYVTGGGEYPYGASISLKACANEGYEFVKWGDESTENPRTVTVSQDETYTAYFDVVKYELIVNSNDPTMGVVMGGGRYDPYSTVTISATPNMGYEFVQWNDGNTETTRTVTLSEKTTTYTATFRAIYYTINANPNYSYMGVVYGGGDYVAYSTATLTAVASEGYGFIQWNDGIKDNPRDIVVIGDATYEAIFNAVNYTLTLTVSDNSMGYVTGEGTYPANSTATIQAYPYINYQFVSWSDGSTENPRNIQMTGDIALEATFRSTVGLHNGYEYVDLGLPSGTLWATCNIGASNPQATGNYYAWGETVSKETYEWSTYQHCGGSANTLTKYNSDASYGSVDNKTTLELSDDAAFVNWGSGWRIPTSEQLRELHEQCNWVWDSSSGCFQIVGPNGSSVIYLKGDGYKSGSSINESGDVYLWSSALWSSYSSYNTFASYLFQDYQYQSSWSITSNSRYYGLQIRPVYVPE